MSLPARSFKPLKTEIGQSQLEAPGIQHIFVLDDPIFWQPFVMKYATASSCVLATTRSLFSLYQAGMRCPHQSRWRLGYTSHEHAPSVAWYWRIYGDAVLLFRSSLHPAQARDTFFISSHHCMLRRGLTTASVPSEWPTLLVSSSIFTSYPAFDHGHQFLSGCKTSLSPTRMPAASLTVPFSFIISMISSP